MWGVIGELHAGSTSDNYILIIDRLKKYFPITAGGIRSRIIGWVKAVDDVSFKVVRGKTFAIVGESGSGKTTLARTISGIYEPTSGRIFFDGKEITTFKQRSKAGAWRDISIVFQDPTSSLNPRHKIKDIVTAPLRVHKIGDKKYMTERARELLKLVELDERYLNAYPHELSGGQRQRVAIARALALNPKLVVLDEPTSSLDVSVQAKILDLLKDVKKKLNLTYLLITHNLGVVRNFADETLVMYAGKMVELAPTEEIVHNPKHPYTKALLSAVPPIAPEEEEFIKKVGIEPKPGDPPSLSNPPRGCRFHPRCPLATEKCRVEEPPCICVSKNHVVCCHLYSS